MKNLPPNIRIFFLIPPIVSWSNVMPAPACSARVECLTKGMDMESCFHRGHEAHEGMHHHQKMNRIRF